MSPGESVSFWPRTRDFGQLNSITLPGEGLLFFDLEIGQEVFMGGGKLVCPLWGIGVEALGSAVPLRLRP
jgi:hypothetical protein